jgi:hypothetical protein
LPTLNSLAQFVRIVPSIAANDRATLEKPPCLAAGQTILDDAGKLNARLATSARNSVDGVQADTDTSSWQARQKIVLTT